jgi:hypothetical protein
MIHGILKSCLSFTIYIINPYRHKLHSIGLAGRGTRAFYQAIPHMPIFVQYSSGALLAFAHLIKNTCHTNTTTQRSWPGYLEISEIFSGEKPEGDQILTEQR